MDSAFIIGFWIETFFAQPVWAELSGNKILTPATLLWKPSAPSFPAPERKKLADEPKNFSVFNQMISMFWTAHGIYSPQQEKMKA